MDIDRFAELAYLAQDRISLSKLSALSLFQTCRSRKSSGQQILLLLLWMNQQNLERDIKSAYSTHLIYASLLCDIVADFRK